MAICTCRTSRKNTIEIYHEEIGLEIRSSGLGFQIGVKPQML